MTLAAAGGTASTSPAQDIGIKGAKIDHVSIQVNDLPHSIAFYQTMFGLTVVSEDKLNEIVRLGTGKTLVSPPTRVLPVWWITSRSASKSSTRK